MSISEREGLRTWIEVDQKAIKHNFGIFRGLIPKKTKLMAVVKSNAYGHGLVDFSREMERLGADFLGVDSITEARSLRREGIKIPILVLGYTMPELFAEAAQNDISLTVSSFEIFDTLKKAELSKPLKIHIKVDTGMHRQGFLKGDLPRVLLSFQHPRLPIGGQAASSVQLQGLYTHFANAKNPAFPKDTRAQIAEFEQWIIAFKKAGLKPLVHAAATASTMLFPETHYDMVRIGIGLYGLWPAREVREFLKDKITLRPALEWKSIVSEIKKLPRGARVGYDFAEMLQEDTTLAIIPIGYWHGYSRALSSIGRVLIQGKECKVVGRVSMDMLTVDVSKIKNLRVGDEVVIITKNQKSPASAEGISLITDSSWYEVVTRLNPLIKRIYI
ncbi:MAG: alanine racemase [Parcubacteria group bacterium Gr01-1014_17]|nr:MAG: alanine racemase [Parcubacteria group bacterium Gr01-1014_17]